MISDEQTPAPAGDVSPPTVAAQPLWRQILAFPLVAMVLALAALLAAIAAVGFFYASFGLADVSEGAGLGIGGITTSVVAIVVAKLVIARLGEQPRDDLPFDGRVRDLAGGITIGFALMAISVAIVALLGGYVVRGWGGSTSWPMILFMAGVQAAVVEEIMVRGIIFRFLEEFGGSWFALALSAGLFGFGHYMNPNADVFSSLAIALEAGIMLGAAYMLTRSLWLAIGIHFGWNVTQGYLFDVPVSGNDVDGLVDAAATGHPLISGGAFGIEASVVALVLATGFGIWLLLRAVRAGQVMRPWWVRRREGPALKA